MGRRGGGGTPLRRHQSPISPAILRRRIYTCNINHLSPDDIAEHLYSTFPDYKHFKFIPFRTKINQILHNFDLRPQNDAAFFQNDDVEDGGEDSDVRTSSRKKRRKVAADDEDEREQRLLERENEHFRRRSDIKSPENSTSDDEEVSGSDVEPEFDFMTRRTENSMSDDEEVSVSDVEPEFDFMTRRTENSTSDDDKVSGDDVEPVFDFMNSLIRESYKGESSKSKTIDSGGGGGGGGIGEESNMKVEGARREKKISGEVAVVAAAVAEKSGSEVVDGSDGEAKGKGKEGGIRFRDLGGIKEVIDELMMEVIVPLYHPELPKWIGVKPMSGILLHGPPGCGKTRLAQAIANETGVPFYQISATEVVSGVSGASEESIRELFTKAYQTAPSIVFIDEIDAIASKRENLQREMERRIVTQLLTCMDESHMMVKSSDKNSDTELDGKKSGYVLVIGATNRPDAVDSALRRPGRFDREIALGVPDENARAEILSVLTKKLRLAGDFDLRKIAKATPGFVGADLVALANKAGNLAMKRIIDLRRSGISSEEEKLAEEWWKEPWSPEEMKNLSITMSDFEFAVKLVQPSSRREGFSTIPDVKWEDVGGLDGLRKQFELYIVNRIKYPTQYEESGVDLETGFLLYGPPGCGKTLIAKAVANEAGANFIHIKGPELLNKYVGESESHVRRIFSRARTCAPCILFFDEVDALTTERGKEGGWVVERLLNQLLIELNGGDHRRGVYVIGATNRPEVMDHALLRPGRFGKLLFVPLPSSDERGMILTALARKKPIDASVNLLDLGARCENMSGADLSALMNEAAMAALEEKLKSSTTVCGGCSSNIKSVHFELAMSKVKPSVSEKQKQYYEKLSQTFRAV
ncbi:cell division control protein 48 homolog C-like [Silene latifolia]|uniref:cell division control protein 48 homolog C-like n=1 Tax=Silene latifolia TaxID=37657 RepID=UPI003D77CF9F